MTRDPSLRGRIAALLRDARTRHDLNGQPLIEECHPKGLWSTRWRTLSVGRRMREFREDSSAVFSKRVAGRGVS
jgi:hypothetical protein